MGVGLYVNRGIVCLVLSLGFLSRTTLAKNRGDASCCDASYFGHLLDKEGAEGLWKTTVRSPSLLPPLLSGIATGSTEWIDVYDRFRRGLDSVDFSESLRDRLDNSLARALVLATERVLSYLHGQPKIPAGQICERPPSRAGVLAPRELLTIVRRKRSLQRVNGAELEPERSTCIAATTDLLRRQLRIYLVSHGAVDSKSKASSKLTVSERRELEAVDMVARKDPALRARGDGTLPDGPFRRARIPRKALKRCVDHKGRIANPEGPWELTDYITDERLPRVRLLNACQVAANEWDLTCQHGGYAPYFRHVRVRRGGEKWIVIQENDDRRTPGSFEEGHMDLWADCRSLSVLATPSNTPLQSDKGRKTATFRAKGDSPRPAVDP